MTTKLIDKLIANGHKASFKNIKDVQYDLIHPLRLMKHNQIMPLNLLFNSKSESFSKISMDRLQKECNPFEATETLSKSSPLFLQEILQGDASTFTAQLNTSFFRLYMHSFYLNGGNIKTKHGSLGKTKTVFVPIKYEQYCNFDEKIRPVDGYYIFIGDKVNSIVIQGKPLNTIAGPRLILHDFNITKDILPFENDFIFNCFKEKNINAHTISLDDIFNRTHKIGETVTKALKMI